VTPVPGPQVDPKHYLHGYDHPGRFVSYWHQIDEVTRLGGRIIEIGMGNGTVAAILRARGFDVTTVDIDPALGPDVTADIRSLPFPDSSFDTAVVAEVLEHLPWTDVGTALGEVARVATRGAVLSVPDSDVAFSVEVRLPNALQLVRLAARRRIPLRHALWGLSLTPSWRRAGGTVRSTASIPLLHPGRKPKCGEHYWELGVAGIDRLDFARALELSGFRLIRDYRVTEHPYHHFFVLSRPNAAPSSR
jgi:SAM-dependent methyltransferase